MIAQLMLRARRMWLSIWLLALFGFLVSTIPAYDTTLAQGLNSSTEAIAKSMNAGMSTRFMYGILPTDMTVGVLARWEMGAWMATLGGVMSIMLTAYLTRGFEQTDRAQMIRATGVKPRRLPLAAVGIVLGTSAALGVLMTIAMVVGKSDINEMTNEGAILFGVTIAVIFAAFGMIAFVIAQFARTSRGVNSAGLGALGIAYVMRAVADVKELDWLRAASPLGWLAITDSFHDNAWWTLIPMMSVVVVLLVVGLWMNLHRDINDVVVDLGFGKKKIKTITPRGYGHFGLRVRLERLPMIWWFVGISVFAMLMASMVADIAKLFANADGTAELMTAIAQGSTAEESFIYLVAMMIAMLLAAAATQFVLSFGAEERNGRIANVLAGRSPSSVLGMNWLVAMAYGIVVASIVAPIVAVIADARARFDLFTVALWSLLGAIPIVILVTGLSVLLLSIHNRLGAAVWAVIVLSAFLAFFGKLMEFDDWIIDLSIFMHTPYSVEDGWVWTGCIVMTVLGGISGALGLLMIRRRDLHQT